jgi:hypothetical protein
VCTLGANLSSKACKAAAGDHSCLCTPAIVSQHTLGCVLHVCLFMFNRR